MSITGRVNNIPLTSFGAVLDTANDASLFMIHDTMSP